jgi:hypothetical protein
MTATRNRTPALNVRFAEDAAAQAFVEAHPHGAPASEVAAVYGLSRQAIELIEKQALRSMALRCAVAGITRADASGLGRSEAGEEAA